MTFRKRIKDNWTSLALIALLFIVLIVQNGVVGGIRAAVAFLRGLDSSADPPSSPVLDRLVMPRLRHHLRSRGLRTWISGNDRGGSVWRRLRFDLRVVLAVPGKSFTLTRSRIHWLAQSN
jgi:hypothetical protein